MVIIGGKKICNNCGSPKIINSKRELMSFQEAQESLQAKIDFIRAQGLPPKYVNE